VLLRWVNPAPAVGLFIDIDDNPLFQRPYERGAGIAGASHVQAWNSHCGLVHAPVGDVGRCAEGSQHRSHQRGETCRRRGNRVAAKKCRSRAGLGSAGTVSALAACKNIPVMVDDAVRGRDQVELTAEERIGPDDGVTMGIVHHVTARIKITDVFYANP